MSIAIPGIAGSARVAGALALAALLAGCAAMPPRYDLSTPGTPAVHFPNGRVTFVLTDEQGLPLQRYRVDMSWEHPDFYRTSAFTDSFGRVTFNGVPELANVSIDSPGGLYSQYLLVPQRGSNELPVILQTFGQNAQNMALQNRYISSSQK